MEPLENTTLTTATTRFRGDLGRAPATLVDGLFAYSAWSHGEETVADVSEVCIDRPCQQTLTRLQAVMRERAGLQLRVLVYQLQTSFDISELAHMRCG